MIVKKYPLALLIGVCVALFFSHLDILYVNIMEARNFITAREMLQDDHWIFTTLNGIPRYEKPPLPTWITAFFGSLFGIQNVIALRFPAALMGILLVIYQYLFLLRLSGKQKFAFIGTLILSTSFFILYASRNAQWDIYTHTFMMASIYHLYVVFTTSEKRILHGVLAGVFFGLSFLSKGPVSLYALWLPFLIAYGWVYRFSNFNKKWIGITIFSLVALVISVSWYLYIYMESPNAIETIGKKAWFNWSNYNARPFYYYWSFIVQSGVWTIPSFIGLLYPYLKDKVRDKKAYTFTLIWTLASVVLLSIIPEKKSRFLLPVLIPLACNTAFYIDYLIRHFSELKNSRETGIVYFNFGAIAIIGMLFPISGYVYFGDALSGKWIWYALLSISLLIIGFFILKGLFRKNFEHVFYLSIGYIVAIMLFGMPMASSFTINEQYKPLSTLKEWERENNMKTYAFKNITPELLWSYGGTMELLLDNDELQLPSEEKFAVIVNQEHNELFESTFERFHVEKVDRYDMNPKGPGDKSHKTRLWRNLYVVTKAYIALEASEAPQTQESQEGFQKTSQ